MTELLTAAQMRAIEQAAIDSGKVTGLELMERAGRGVVEAIFQEWPELADDGASDGARRGQPLQASPEYCGADAKQVRRRAVVLCGPGNNGGDGFVVARLLAELGWDVEVFLYGDPEKLPPDARVNYERWVELGEVRPIGMDGFPRLHDRHADVVLDALFGTGFGRAIEGEAQEVLSHIRCAIWPYERSLRELERFVSIDIPTGLCSDSGKVIEQTSNGFGHFRADLTVTFHAAKLGHFLEDGPELTGRLVRKSIGLAHRFRSAAERQKSNGRIVRLRNPVGSELEKLSSHKYTHGHALILSGGPGAGGAARLAARGALRIGAGVVTVGCPPAALQENAARLDAIMLRSVGDAEVFGSVLADDRINALCLGPGLGLGETQAALVGEALRRRDESRLIGGNVGRGSPRRTGTPRRSVVLDADALTLLSRDETLFDALHNSCVLTPHAGEFARLFPDIAEKLAEVPTKGPAYSKVDATREAAARAGCVVLFKGPDTVIAHPDGRASINSAHYDRAAPWLATAGSGDVLAGFITGLLARGFQTMEAAETAAWLHVECALAFGPGLIAEDLPEMLPHVLAKLNAN